MHLQHVQCSVVDHDLRCDRITTMSMMMEVSEVIKSDGDDDDDEYDNDGG